MSYRAINHNLWAFFLIKTEIICISTRIKYLNSVKIELFIMTSKGKNDISS